MSPQPVAVVTGTSTGFGHLIASGLRADGYRVFATMRDVAGRNAPARAALAAEGIDVLDMDVTDDASVHAAATAILAAGRVDVLVNNAGTAHMGITEAFTPAAIERQFATNLVGAARVTRALLPTMRGARSGLVVFVSSVVGRFALPFLGVYAGSKFALEAYAEALSYELFPVGVDVAIVEPGAYATNIFNAIVGPDDTERVASYGATADIFAKLTDSFGASAGDPTDVAHAIRHLAGLPGGHRPLRTVVPSDAPAVAINAAVAPIQRAIVDGFGFGELQAPEPVHATSQ